ncbi:hypothetical protein [Streptomyces xiaopingdaonensis]|uniref:hypothetical protein n=1 Tax=Streptomyces xiaopingdaonensis TaxID=1565415 RepID=UPI000998204D|nr:hypothetical protein [Streptomyces xiaopingdaonensis]
MRKRRVVLVLVGSVVVLASVFAGILVWANTDAFGKEASCRDVLDAGEVDSVLSGPGRITDNARENTDPYGFACDVELAQKIGGGPPAELTTKLTLRPADYALSSVAVWDGHASYSYFTGERAGAVSHEQGWLLLPQKCHAVIPDNVRGDPQIYIQVELENTRADKTNLATVLLRTANHVTSKLGCDAPDRWRSSPIDLRGPTTTNTPDNTALCGNTLTPPDALPKGHLKTPEQEQHTAPGTTTGACELTFPGTGDRRLTFTWSTHPALTHGASLAGANRNLSKATDRVLVPCGDKKLYAHVHSSSEYGAALEDATSIKGEGTVMRGWLRSYVNALSAEHRCASSGG